MKAITITRGLVALVDDEDYERLSSLNWQAQRASHGWYAKRHVRCAGKWPACQFMHRMIMMPARGMVVDHIDGNGLNNQRSNLRVCTHKQNSANRNKRKAINTSPYVGVHFCNRSRKWVASITVNYKKKHVGYFRTMDEAAAAYDKASAELRGEFATLNLKEVS